MVVFTGALATVETVAAGVGVAITTGVADGAGAGASWVSFTLIVGDENSKLAALI